MIKSLENGQKAALIVNECQIGILDPRYAIFPALAEQVAARDMVANIARLVSAFRARSTPIFFTPALQRADLADNQVNTLIAAVSRKSARMVLGMEEAKYMPGLEPIDSDFVVPRTAGLIAFHGTNLDLTLRRLGIQTVVITGVSTNVAIPGLTMAATDLGYHVVIPEDCIAGSDPQAHNVIVEQQLRMLATITTGEQVTAAID